MHRGFRDDIGVETVAKIDRINVVTAQHIALARVHLHAHILPPFRARTASLIMIATIILGPRNPQSSTGEEKRQTHHSRSLYMIVKKTCKNRLTALMSTANRYSHASPDIMTCFSARGYALSVPLFLAFGLSLRSAALLQLSACSKPRARSRERIFRRLGTLRRGDAILCFDTDSRLRKAVSCVEG